MPEQDREALSSPAPGLLELLDLDDLPGDEKLPVTALQGLINRSYPSLYLLHGHEEGKLTWLRELPGASSSVTYNRLADLLERHRATVNGLIIYDPDLPDSINVALTLAGLEQSLPVTPRLAERLGGEPYLLTVHADLRGQFSNRLDAYTWQFATLWPRCTHSMLVGISPTMGNPANPYGGLLQDYAVAHRAMVFWLDPNVPGERTLFETILRDVSPCTPYLGWFPQDVAGEFSGTELTSAHSVYVLAADHCANLSVFSDRMPSLYTTTAASATTPSLENKIYVTFTLSEGDNLQYMQHRMRRLWDDPARGQVPLNWSIDPLALKFAPALLDFYLRTRTPQDCLIAGPSGAGYCYPNAWPDTTFHSFTRQSAEYMHQLGLEVLWVFNREAGQSVPLDAAHAYAYLADISPLGILLNYESYTETSIVHGQLPQAVTQGVASVEDALGALAIAGLLWDGTSPLFLSLGLLAWTMKPSDVATVVQTLTPPYQVVRADEYFRLVRKAFGLPQVAP